MANPLPMTPNCTADIYRTANPNSPLPAGNPAVAAVPGYLKPWAAHGRFGSASWLKWTHILTLPIGTDVRDAYNSQLDPARANTIADTVVVKDSATNTRTPFYVVFVELAYRGTPQAQIRVYLDRFQPSAWPTGAL
jgi:hypothetical protein